MKRLFLIVFVLFYSLNVNALSFQQPSNYEESSKCRKKFDSYVKKQSKVWTLENEKIKDSCNKKCKNKINKEIAKLQKSSKKSFSKVNKYCIFDQNS